MFNPERPKIEERGSEMSVKEIDKIISIVDREPDREIMKKVDSENIREIVDRGVDEIRETRKKGNERYVDWNTLDVFNDFKNRFSSSHAVECSVNGAEDSKFLQEKIDLERMRRDGLDGAGEFLGEQIKDYELLTKLYQIDIARRVGLIKKKEGFFKEAMRGFIDIRNRLKKRLDNFEKRNKGKEGFSDFKEELEKLREVLNKSEEDLEEKFYEDICQAYSNLIFADFESFNGEEIEIALRGDDREEGESILESGEQEDKKARMLKILEWKGFKLKDKGFIEQMIREEEDIRVYNRKNRIIYWGDTINYLDKEDGESRKEIEGLLLEKFSQAEIDDVFNQLEKENKIILKKVDDNY